MLVPAHFPCFMVCVTHPRSPARTWVERCHVSLRTHFSKFLCPGSVCVAIAVNTAGQSTLAPGVSPIYSGFGRRPETSLSTQELSQQTLQRESMADSNDVVQKSGEEVPRKRHLN